MTGVARVRVTAERLVGSGGDAGRGARPCSRDAIRRAFAEAPPPEAAPGRDRPARAACEPDRRVGAGSAGQLLRRRAGRADRERRMRLDTAPADAPFGVDDLVRNFERIALYDEYVDVGGRFVRRESPALLRKWDQPVRVGVVIGPSVPPEIAARDREEVAAFTARLARLTGLDMKTTEGPDANFLVMILSSAEQSMAAEATAAQFPDFQPAVLGALGGTPIDTFCTAYAFAEPGRSSAYAAVMVLIRAEHPPLTRASCVHEEMAQAMGLPNDSPDARPSLFNDSLEFAFLTDHDEILLRMLYDPPAAAGHDRRRGAPAAARDRPRRAGGRGGGRACGGARRSTETTNRGSPRHVDLRFPPRRVHRRHPLDRRHPRHHRLALRAAGARDQVRREADGAREPGGGVRARGRRSPTCSGRASTCSRPTTCRS